MTATPPVDPALAPHTGFEWIRTRPVATLGLTVSEYRHTVTGAVHYHLAADNDENVFLVALRTVPTDSTGVAHILEHTALCGSERYPVRDPFFMMVRRSLNTFMNAFTSSDWTAYPFASKNARDFDNLLDVYLDAVFFSRLDPLDFAQEGHRLEFETPDDPGSPLVIRGVVYNEMKGAMSSPVSVLYQTLTRHLFPTTTYHFNSGGEPDCIPDLTYAQLKAFYATHYHPSNAVFMTYGNRRASELQARFHDQVLHRFERLDRHIHVPREKRIPSPIRVEEGYAWQLQPDETAETVSRTRGHVVMGWLLGDSTDLRSTLEAQLMSEILLENSASPLRLMLETCGLGDAPSPLCGIEDSNRELVFMCGLEGCDTERAAEIEARIMEVLTTVAREGVTTERLEAVLHQIELSQREIGGDGYPYGLQLILAGLSSAIHRGDPIAVLDLDPVLADLREAIRDADFIPRLIRRWLLDNPHRVRLTLRPDPALETHRDTQLRADLDALKAGLDTASRQSLVEQARALMARQADTPDPGCLPKVGLADVPEQTLMPVATLSRLGRADVSAYAQGTNGLVYHQIVTPLPSLDDEALQDIPLLSALMGDLGAGEHDYLSLQHRISAVSGGVAAFSLLRSDPLDVQRVQGCFGLSGKALVRHQAALTELLHTLFHHARFDEHGRIRELITQYRSRLEQSVGNSGHSFAMSAACAGMNPTARATHLSGGLAGVQRLQQLDDSLDGPDTLKAFCQRLEDLFRRLTAEPPGFLVVGEQAALKDGLDALAGRWTSLPETTSSGLALPPVAARVREAWLTQTQVSFCAKAYPTVAADHPDAASLAVLGGVLRNGFLHRAIREQGGAYGGGASQDSSVGAFRFYSYRDPRIGGTLADFDAAIEWVGSGEVTEEALEEAILGIIAGLDKPGSPAGEAKQAFQNRWFGRDDAFFARFRSRILSTTRDDLSRVAERYLMPEKASVAIVTSPTLWDADPQPDLTVHRI